MTTTIDSNSVVSDATSIDDTDSPYTTSGEGTIQVDTSSGAVTVTLATADVKAGREIRVVDTGLNAGTNAITINTEGSETINPGAQSSITLGIDGGYEDLWSDSTNWFTSRRREDLQTDALTTALLDNAGSNVSVGDTLAPDADDTHDLGTSTAQFNQAFLAELNGTLTGDQSVTNLAGHNLNIDGSGNLEASNATAADSNTTTSGPGIYLIDTSGGARTLTIASSDISNEAAIGAVNISGTNALTVDTEGTETIDPGGASSKTLSTGGWLVWFNGDGTNVDASLDADVESLTTDQATIDGLVGVPLGDQESGSPYSASAANSINPSSLDTFETYIVNCQVADNAGSNNNVDLQVGGDTGANYREIDLAGTQNTGQNEISPVQFGTANASDSSWFILMRRGGIVGFRNLAGSGSTSQIISGDNTNVNWPPGQFTLKRGVSTDWTVRIWGRDP